MAYLRDIDSKVTHLDSTRVEAKLDLILGALDFHSTAIKSGLDQIIAQLEQIIALIGTTPINPATHAVLTFNPTQGVPMPGQITVDTTNETVTLAWVDDKGDTDAAAPDGAVVTFTSDNEFVASVTADPANPLQGDVTAVSEGTANLGAAIADAAGNPILEPDGVTPFAVDPVTVTVSAGAAVGAALTLSV